MIQENRIPLLMMILAALSVFSTIFLPYIGEEGVYTITSLEMGFHQTWITPTLYGSPYFRPPLFNWLIIPIANAIGWEHVLVASRLVTATATVCTALLLFWWTKKLFRDTAFSLLSTLIFLSGDLLLFRGWLAYSDPLFSFFIFSAIVCSWIALETDRPIGLFWAGISLFLSFLTKAITGYVFYGIAMSVLVWRHPKGRRLLSPLSLLLHTLAVLGPVLWWTVLTSPAHQTHMLWDATSKFNVTHLQTYFLKIALFPLDTFVRWLPTSALIIAASYKLYAARRLLSSQRSDHKEQVSAEASSVQLAGRDGRLMGGEILNWPEREKKCVHLVAWITFLNYALYWAAPHAHVRYLLPLYPLGATLLAYSVSQGGQARIKIALYGVGACIFLKFFIGWVWFPLYQEKHRGNYKWVAQDIIKRTQGWPLYTADPHSTGLCVTAHLDVLRSPQAPLILPPTEWDHGFVIASSEEIPNTHITHIYTLSKKPFHLLCRGDACGARN